MIDDVEGRIAIIGWGSLIWDLDDLAPKVDGTWQMGAGPVLPFEFSRISPKRRGALAVCIDPVNGTSCTTNTILSNKGDIHEASDDLRVRERAKDIGYIGAYCRVTGFQRSRIAAVGRIVERWCHDSGAAGAVWTDLEDNFATQQGAPFSVSAGIAYLRGLTGESFAEAVRYIEKAPAATDTALRRALKAEPWWQDAALRLLPQ